MVSSLLLHSSLVFNVGFSSLMYKASRVCRKARLLVVLCRITVSLGSAFLFAQVSKCFLTGSFHENNVQWTLSVSRFERGSKKVILVLQNFPQICLVFADFTKKRLKCWECIKWSFRMQGWDSYCCLQLIYSRLMSKMTFFCPIVLNVWSIFGQIP